MKHIPIYIGAAIAVSIKSKYKDVELSEETSNAYHEELKMMHRLIQCGKEKINRKNEERKTISSKDR